MAEQQRMARQVIPDAAVEAALARLPLESAPIVGRVEMRAALEAAAPHMQELQWGVRDIVSLHIAGHPSEESANATADAHPEWYEVVSRPMPGLWTAK